MIKNEMKNFNDDSLLQIYHANSVYRLIYDEYHLSFSNLKFEVKFLKQDMLDEISN